MSSLRLTSFFIFHILIIYLAERITGDVVDPVAQYCSDPDYDIPHSEHVGDILASIYFKAPVAGFGNDAVKIGDRYLYGFLLCRGDIKDMDLCRKCIIATTNLVRERCPYSKEAMGYYNECWLSYREVDLYSAPDDTVNMCVVGSDRPSDPPTYANVVQALLAELATSATSATNLYAASSLYGVYAYVQCSMDISASDCKSCLDGLISQLPGSCADGFTGGRLIGGTCLFRFDNFPFIN